MRDSLTLHVRPGPGPRHAGTLRFGTRSMRCALGRAGLAAIKREGDGATPAGCWPLREVFYRPDRVARPRTRLPVRPLRADDGWCDDPASRNYNRKVRLPARRSAEGMWREDGLYDIVVVLGYNDLPRARGKGSAIFLHLPRVGYGPTEGCVALAARDLLALLERCGPGSRIVIGR